MRNALQQRNESVFSFIFLVKYLKMKMEFLYTTTIVYAVHNTVSLLMEVIGEVS